MSHLRDYRIILRTIPTTNHVHSLPVQEDVLQLNGLGTSSTFDLTAVGLPDGEVSQQFMQNACLQVFDAYQDASAHRKLVWLGLARKRQLRDR